MPSYIQPTFVCWLSRHVFQLLVNGSSVLFFKKNKNDANLILIIVQSLNLFSEIMSVNTVNDEFRSLKKFTSLSEQLQIFNGEKQIFCLIFTD